MPLFQSSERIDFGLRIADCGLDGNDEEGLTGALQNSSQSDDGLGLLPPVSDLQKVLQDYRSTGLSLRKHPMAFLRDRLNELRAVPTSDIRDARRQPHGSFARVAGVVLVRQRPSSAAGVLFITIEDETGSANIMFFISDGNTVAGTRNLKVFSTFIATQADFDKPKD
jgi:error-prone DNA polymerase